MVPHDEERAPPPRLGTLEEIRDQLLVIMDRMERIDAALESLEGRANTLVRLLDLVGRRVDHLEARR